MLNLMFWILLSAISFISVVIVWQKEDLDFIEMKKFIVVDSVQDDVRVNKDVVKINRNKIQKNDRKSSMKFYDLEQRTNSKIIKYVDINNNKRKNIVLYPISDNSKDKNKKQVVA